MLRFWADENDFKPLDSVKSKIVPRIGELVRLDNGATGRVDDVVYCFNHYVEHEIHVYLDLDWAEKEKA